MKKTGLLVLAVLVALACTVYAAPEQKKMTPAAQPHAGASYAQDEEQLISGKVVETMSSGGYTYVCLENKDKKTWVAVPEMNVTVGEDMSFQPGSAMPNFTSKSLNRSFDVIYFSNGPAASGKQAGKPAKVSPGSKPAASPTDMSVKVEKAVGANAYTVAEIYAKKSALNKKKVLVKGTVVKVSAGIMGKNFIHLQDGTGNAAKGTNNLVATSDDLPAKGDVITVTGTITKDKDFGSGYKYDVIMEHAKIQK